MANSASWTRALTLRPRAVPAATLVTALVVTTLATATPAEAAPASPGGLAPDAVSVSGSPVLTWGRVRGSAGYEVQVDDDEGFDSPLWSSTTTNLAAVPTVALPEGTLLWRVRTLVSGDASDWSTATFDLDPAAPPGGLSPAPGSQLQPPDDTPLLSWGGVAGAQGYDVEIDTGTTQTADWVSPLSYTVAGTSLVVPGPQARGDYAWRVRVRRPGGLVGQWSEPADYTVLPLADPATDPGVQPRQLDVVLDWDPVPGAVRYQVQVGLDADFNEVVDDQKAVVGTRYSPPRSYDNDQYFWRVRGIDAGGAVMPWGPSESIEFFQRRWLDQPSITYPTDGDTVGGDFYVSWTPVTHASRYEVQVSNDPSFPLDRAVTRICYTAQTTYIPGTLDDDCLPPRGGVVYWRVRGLDLGPTTSPATIEGIYSDPVGVVWDPAVLQTLSPADGDTIAVPTLSWEPLPDIAQYAVLVTDAGGSKVESVITYSTSWTVAAPMDPADGPFTWTVTPIDANGRRGATTPEQVFELGGVPATGEPLAPLSGADPDAPVHRFPSLTWVPDSTADYYRVQIRARGTTVWEGGTTSPLTRTKFYHPGAADNGDRYLAAGTYEWRAVSYAGGVASAYGPVAAFTIAPLDAVAGQQVALTGTALDAGLGCRAALGNDAGEQVCDGLPSTPVLDWESVEGAAFYIVYLANDREMTNRVYSPLAEYQHTTNTRWTPRFVGNAIPDQMADNQAQTSYYWYIRPCYTAARCAADPVGRIDGATNAFRKRSPAPTPSAPLGTADAPAPVHDDVTFTWSDYRADNAAVTWPPAIPGAPASHQSGLQYHLQVATDATFDRRVVDVLVDQSTFTPYVRMLPEGLLYWRVQAVDSARNPLPWSPVQVIRKSSGAVDLDQASPAVDEHVAGTQPFRWPARAFAAGYQVEIYKNDDASSSTGNRVATGTTALAAFVPTKPLAPSATAYRWRVRWLDVSGNPGAWSTGGRFFVDRSTLTPTSPAGGAILPGSGGFFSWEPVAGAASYTLELRRTGSTSSFLRIVTVAGAAATTKLADGAFEWRVTAFDTAKNTIAQSRWRRGRVDATAPTVASRQPTGVVGSGARFKVTFSEEVTDVDSGTFRLQLKGRTTDIAATVSLAADGLSATLDPEDPLDSGKTYVVKLTSGIEDLAGNALTPLSWQVKVS